MKLLKIYDQIIKLVIIGNENVGKSTLFSKYVGRKQPENYTPTVGVDFWSKTTFVMNRSNQYERCLVHVWDTAGVEEYRMILPSVYHGAHGVMIVLDANTKNCLEIVSLWLKEIYAYCDKDVAVTVVANKSDIITDEDIYELNKSIIFIQYDFTLIDTCAIKNENVDAAFTNLLEGVLAKKPRKPEIKRKFSRESKSRLSTSSEPEEMSNKLHRYKEKISSLFHK